MGEWKSEENDIKWADNVDKGVPIRGERCGIRRLCKRGAEKKNQTDEAW